VKRPQRPLQHQLFLRRLLLPAIALLVNLGGGLSCNADWADERIASPFVIHSDFSLQAYASLIDQMGELRKDIVEALSIQQPQEEIHVFLFREKNTYKKYMSHYFPTVPKRRALYIKARGPGMVFAYHSSELDVDVRHESTHALLHAALPVVPLWLDEGLAEYFEVPKEKRAAENPHHSFIKWGARFGHVPSLTKLEEFGDLRDMGKSEYRAAWAWTHFMLHGPEAARNEFIRYLQDLEASVPPGILSQRLRRRIPDLDKQFANHFKAWGN
jgi:hypothetical protein